jgi:HlyD family secretion protein
MRRTFAIFAAVGVLLFASWWFLLRGNGGSQSGVIYRTEKVAVGDATQSFNATGVLQPLTIVDVKSKAGGEIIKLAVQEGSVVKRGDLLAEIDPRDTRAIYEQNQADLTSNTARATQQRYNLEIERVTSVANVENAEAALKSAELRLANLEARASAQPALTKASIDQAKANYEVAVRAMQTFNDVTEPQTRAQVRGELDRAKADLDAAAANYTRQQELLEKGYVAKSAVEQARTAHESAVAAHRNATERFSRLDRDLQIQRDSAEYRVQQAKAAFDQANANSIDVAVSKRDLEDSRQAVRQARASLETARANRRQVDIRRSEVQASQAAIVRSRVSRDNALVQLQSTTVVAPRDGVVITKYVEQGTIIPPGTSTFAQGTSIVQIADVSRMYVEVNVDEADIGRVKLDQPVRVTLESNRRHPLSGRVSRVNPSAVTESGVTQVKVRVEVEGDDEVKLMPGLNAACEFIVAERRNVLVVPTQAIQRDGDATFVEVMVKKDQPVRRDIKLGAPGNSVTEVLDGLKEGEEVVVSKIDVAQIEEQERRMEDAATQRNPFSGAGTPNRQTGAGGGQGGGR